MPGNSVKRLAPLIVVASSFPALLHGSAPEVTNTVHPALSVDCAASNTLSYEEYEALPGGDLRQQADALSDPVQRASAVILSWSNPNSTLNDSFARGAVAEVGENLGIVTTSKALKEYVQSDEGGIYFSGLGWLNFSGCDVFGKTSLLQYPDDPDDIVPVFIKLPDQVEQTIHNHAGLDDGLQPLRLYDIHGSSDVDREALEGDLVPVVPEMDGSFLRTKPAEATVVLGTPDIQLTRFVGDGEMAGPLCPGLVGAVVLRGGNYNPNDRTVVVYKRGQGVYSSSLIVHIFPHSLITGCGDLAETKTFDKGLLQEAGN